MPFFKVAGKMIDYNEETKRYEKYDFEEITFGATVDTAADRLLRNWNSDPNTKRKILNPKTIVKYICPCEESQGISFKKPSLKLLIQIHSKVDRLLPD